MDKQIRKTFILKHSNSLMYGNYWQLYILHNSLFLIMQALLHTLLLVYQYTN